MIRFHEHLWDLLTEHEPEPHPSNPNDGDVDAIMESVVVNGCYAPVWVSRASNRMVKGHHLYLALRELGSPHWPLVFLENLTPEDELRIMLADNKIARKARLDVRAEAEAMRRLRDTDLQYAGTGYEDREVQRMTERIFREDSRPLTYGSDGLHALPRDDTCPCCGQLRKD